VPNGDDPHVPLRLLRDDYARIAKRTLKIPPFGPLPANLIDPLFKRIGRALFEPLLSPPATAGFFVPYELPAVKALNEVLVAFLSARVAGHERTLFITLFT
jgi:hypothetical protein